MLKAFFGMLVGGALGFAAYRFIGCTTGACPLTSNPWVSTLLGLALGAMFTTQQNSTAPGAKSDEGISK
jgi:hypothetical protein